ncbi:hypothetical protein [Vibrio sp. ABG19]|uniref:hypothetical protein n=1 Tax=Vibrio sp. ABG19 TaxID=2817385 RepID=UPI00249E4E1C|nr:hypothetical protein [Vibrio sp. ABG19]WGY45659.1 hypothetical protein J0X00_02085 [Vibrio sp. ABG19]
MTQQKDLLEKLKIKCDLDKEVIWQTQYSIITDTGTIRYPDLVGLVDNAVVYVIEVKIDARFTTGTDLVGDSISQLEIYDSWLFKHASASHSPALVLLTNKTLPESQFLGFIAD